MTSATDPANGERLLLASDGYLFRVGDAVLASTAGKPTSWAASIVEIDPVDRSRFKVAFQDKRRKGGWRHVGELSALPPLSHEPSAVAIATGGAIRSKASAWSEPKNDVSHISSSSQGSFANRAIHAAASNTGRVTLPPPRHDAEPLSSSKTLTPPARRVDSQPSSSVINALDKPLPSGVQPTEATTTADTAVGGDRQGRGRHLSSDSRVLRVGDAVLARTTGKSTYSKATVIELDPSDGSRFKVAFKNKRKRAIWRKRSELSGLHEPMGADSTAVQQPPSGATRDSGQAVVAGSARSLSAQESIGGAGVTSFGGVAPEPVEIAAESETISGQLPNVPPASGASLDGSADYRVGDAVLSRSSRRSTPSEATIVEADPSDDSRFRVSFLDKRKKGGWRDKSELSRLDRSTDASSTAAATTSSVDATTCDAPGTTIGATPGQASGTPEPEAPNSGCAFEKKATTKALVPGLQQSGKNRKRPKTTLMGNLTEESGATAGEGDITSKPLKRKRAAATAAAVAISATASAGSRGSASGRNGDSTRKNPENTKKTAKAKWGSTPGVIRKTPHKKGWQRPKIVTPGSLEGRPECALRITHPTELIRPRKQFKVQQARVKPTSTADASGSKRGMPRSSFLIGRSGTSGSGAPRQMLCQPTHLLQDAIQGLVKRGDGEEDKRREDEREPEKGRQPEDDVKSDVRRGQRVRRQIHSSLSEDTMAAAKDYDSDEGSDGDGEVANDAPFHLRTSDVAPWGEGDKPLVKVRLNLLEGGAPFSAERSALSVVTFTFDRHRYSGEQLANVLTADGFLCYCEEYPKRVFVLTERKEADQKEALKRVRELALSRCGVRVDTVPWLSGWPALDEFLNNHRRVLDLTIRHRLACGMWSEVGGVYFNALFCGRRSKRTFNGVRLSINLAVEHNHALESGVWELWIAVEPAVHRFSPVDWWALMQEKQDKELRDFSGSKSDDLEERLQVVCLPKLSRGVVFDVKEDAFEMDSLQEADFKRGYLVGPRSEDEMVEYWRQVHHLNLPSTNFVFVKVQIGGMVLTYPSWCVVREQIEVPEATRAMRGRILNSFTDALDGMEGIDVVDTTFSWRMLGGEGGGGRGSLSAAGSDAFGDTPAFATANGNVVGQPKSNDTAQSPSTPIPLSPVLGAVGRHDQSHDGEAQSVCRGENESIPTNSERVPTVASGLRAPSAGALEGCPNATRDGMTNECNNERGSTSAPPVTPCVINDSSLLSPTPPLLVRQEKAQQSPLSRAAASAAQASVAAVRKSFVRRRGHVMLKKAPPRPTAGATAAASAGTRVCSTTFMIRRKPSPSLSAAPAGGSGASDEAGGQVSGESQTRDPTGNDTAPMVPRHEKKTVGTGPHTSLGDRDETTATSAAIVVTPGSPGRDVRRVSAGAGRKRRKSPLRSKTRDVSTSSRREGRKLAKKGNEESEVFAEAGAEAAGYAKSMEVRHAPAPMVIKFSAEGSLGMGLVPDVTEEGTMCLAGKAPTSAVAGVPNGWRITDVNGKSVRRVGDERIAALLAARPVVVTFEEVPKVELDAAATGEATTAQLPTSAAPRKRRAPAKSKAPAGIATKSEVRLKAKPSKGKGKGKGKKMSKVFTVRKPFKVQSRALSQGKSSEEHDVRGGGDDGRVDGIGGGGHIAAAIVPVSSTAAAI